MENQLGRLPPEVVALIQHVELSEAGWWEQGIQRLIRAVLWLAGRPMTVSEISEQLGSELGVNLRDAEVQEQTEALISRGDLLPAGDGRLKIPETQLSSLEADLAEGAAIESNARGHFDSLVMELCPALFDTELWARFNDEVLTPLVRDLGATAYEFILGEAFDLEVHPHQAVFLSSFPPESRDGLRRAIVAFLDPTDAPTRAFVLRRLATYFFVEAARLPEETMKSLVDLCGGSPAFWVFVDTNFLFSLLGLHDNPSNEAAAALLSLREEVSSMVDLRFYVTQDTLDEAKSALIRAQEATDNLYLKGSLATAAASVPFSGLAAKFISESLRPGGSARSEDYFGPLIRNLLHLARSKGIELFNRDLSDLHVRQDAIDDIVEHLEFEKKTRGDRAKSYEQVRHDVVLWHLIGDLRESWVESPLTAKYWTATLDFRFLGFDQHKQRRAQVRRCVHPTTLTQLLQFWVPRGGRLDSALVTTLRMPFLFLDVDTSQERSIQRILETLGRFNGSADLSIETVTYIMMNETLQQRIGRARTVEQQVQLVRLELIEHDRQMREELEAARLQTDRLQSSHGEASAEIAELRRRGVVLQDELTRTARLVDEQAIDRKRRSSLSKFYAMSLPVRLLAPAALLGCIAALLIVVGHARQFPVSLLATAAWMLVSGGLALRAATRHPYASGHSFWKRAKAASAVVGALVVGILGSAVYDWIRSGIHATFPHKGVPPGH